MPKSNGTSKPIKQTISAQTLEKFLDALAETSNVTASAAAAGLNTSQIYRKRIASPQFRAQWVVALREGYARLEADMLAEARTKDKPKDADNVEDLRSRAMRHRLSMNLLAAHRKSVTGEGANHAVRARVADYKTDLVTRLSALRDRHHVLQAESA